MKPQQIFFSYSRMDGEPFALRLANDLRKHNVNVWIDQLSITPGVTWDRAIEEALDSSNCVLFVATEKSTSSNNVLNEVSYALDENKKVIPVIFHKCRMPLLLRRLQHIDFTTDYDVAFNRLLETLNIKGETALPLQTKNENDIQEIASQKQMIIEEKKAGDTYKEERKAHESKAVFSGSDRTDVQQAEQNKSRKTIFIGMGVLGIICLAIFLLLFTKGNNSNEGLTNLDSGKSKVLSIRDSMEAEVPEKESEKAKQPKVSFTDKAPVVSGNKPKEKPRPKKEDEPAKENPPEKKPEETETATQPGTAGETPKRDFRQEKFKFPAVFKKPSFYIISPVEKAAIDYPRTTKVTWKKVAEATSYVLQVEYGDSPDFARAGAGTFHLLSSFRTEETSHTFNGVGYQVHRFKVIAKQGEKTLSETPWRYITYTN